MSSNPLVPGHEIIGTVEALGSHVKHLQIGQRVVLVGIVFELLQFIMFPMLVGEKVITAGAIGSPATIATMFNFAGRHTIFPLTETFKFSQVNEAIQKLREGKVRYRAVLTH